MCLLIAVDIICHQKSAMFTEIVKQFGFLHDIECTISRLFTWLDSLVIFKIGLSLVLGVFSMYQHIFQVSRTPGLLCVIQGIILFQLWLVCRVYLGLGSFGQINLCLSTFFRISSISKIIVKLIHVVRRSNPLLQSGLALKAKLFRYRFFFLSLRNYQNTNT